MENSWFWKRQEEQALIVSYPFAVKASQLTGSVVVSEDAGQPWGNHDPLWYGFVSGSETELSLPCKSHTSLNLA